MKKEEGKRNYEKNVAFPYPQEYNFSEILGPYRKTFSPDWYKG
jgi:hypothetical protein